MAENTTISWADDTFNPWEGCQKVSPACDGCYAEARNLRYAPKGTKAAPNWGPGAPRRRTSDSNWAKPLKWEREQAALWAAHDVEMSEWNMAGIGEHPLPPPPKRRFVFCASLADVFDNAVPVEWRCDLFDLIRATPHLTWLLLTKRPVNIVRLVVGMQQATGTASPNLGAPYDWPRNAAIGCTVVNQEEADRDIPVLLRAKEALGPAFAFVSMEPLLGPVDLTSWLDPTGACEGCDTPGCERLDAPRHEQCPRNRAIFDHPEGPPDNDGVPSWIAEVPRVLDWVITGGETRQGQHQGRPAHPDWFRSLREQCAAAGVAYHHKQNGEWAPGEAAMAGPDARSIKGAYLQEGGSWSICRFSRASVEDLHVEDEPHVWLLGKHSAGRMLDGVTHDARPAVKP